MVIKVESQETSNILRQLCDIALKTGGLQNMNAVVTILNSISIDPSMLGEQKEALKKPEPPLDRVIRESDQPPEKKGIK